MRSSAKVVATLRGSRLMRRADRSVLPETAVVCAAVAATAPMDISLDRVLQAARERRATLTPEVAGYLILLAARQLDAERSQVSAHSVLLDETGEVLVERASAASELDIETALRELLDALVAVCSSPPPAIAAVAERGASGDLRGLVAELSAALIPINHSAAHRALARLYREARRADGHVTDVSLPPIVERSARVEPVSAPLPAAEPGELDIDVVVEAEAAAAAPDALPSPPPPAIEELPANAAELEPQLVSSELGASTFAPEVALDPPPRDLLAPELPTRDPGIHRGGAAELVISHVDADAAEAPDEELRLALPAAAPRWTEARSDVQQLLDAFLAEARSVDHMLGVLRDMIGLDLRSHRDAPLDAPRSRPFQ